MKREELLFSALLLPTDFLMLVFAGFAAYFLRTSDFISGYMPVFFNFSLGYFLEIVSMVAAVWIFIFAIGGLYRIKATKGNIEDFFRIIISSSAGMMFIFVYIFITHEWFNSRFIILAAWFFAVIFVFLGRYFVKKIQKYFLINKNFGVYRVLLVGNGDISDKIFYEIGKKLDYGYKIAGRLDYLDFNKLSEDVKNLKIDVIILANRDLEKEKVIDLIDFCNDNQIDFKFVPNLFETMTVNTKIDAFLGVPLVELKKTNLDGWWRILKRIIDIIGSLFGLFLLFPFFAIVAAAVKIDSSGPALVKLKRVSQGKIFNLYKFRSMIVNAEKYKKDLIKYNERVDGPLFKIKNDPRITRVGKYLRKARIDEFPQLLNVLKGEMSLVGPRPHEPEEIEKYQRHHKKVLAIKAGMTGLAQISGSSNLLFDEEVKIDSYYVDHWSLITDIKILIKTIFILFKGDKSAV